MKAIWKKGTPDETLVAEANQEDLIFIERNWYFPPDSVKREYFQDSETQYTCPWKGDAQFYDVGKPGDFSADNAWSYDTPMQSAKDRVKKDFSGYVCFWRDVTVTE